MRSDLPSGTVTFLFTDVEGSTQLLHDLGSERYSDALAAHRAIVRDACAAHGGVEVDTQGDAFFFVFSSAPGAVAAAGSVVAKLGPGPIKVRIGLHTGTALLTGEGYVGSDVHRAARIAAAGHGGQILLSAATAAVCGQDGLRDLGEHRLKDLSAPERLYQLGDGEFAALKTLYQTNLPVPTTAFVGRERELADVRSLIEKEDVRLLTLAGPGGTGKTRLAIHAAAETTDRFPHGIWWLPLAQLRDASLLLPALAATLHVAEGPPGGDPADRVLAWLAGKRLLLILDNAEHLLPEIATDIARFVQVEGPTVVVTSRERLRLQSEVVWAVPPLHGADGTELFMARARALDPAFSPTAAIGELCDRLENLPLALELAAARTTLFTPAQLLERLSQRLDLLKGSRDADPRQHTLRATMEWSYELLGDVERDLLASLSVFAGGCTFAAAEEVCEAGPDTLESLIDKSLLRRRDEAGEPRYWMLETVRQFAAEKIDQRQNAEQTRARHARWCLELARNRRGTHVREELLDLELELPNVRLAVEFFRESGDVESELDLIGSLRTLWDVQGHRMEGLSLLDDALARGNGISQAVEAQAWQAIAALTPVAARARMRGAAERSVELHRALGDDRGTAVALILLGQAALQAHDLAAAEDAFGEAASIGRCLGFALEEAGATADLGLMALIQGDAATGREMSERALVAFRKLEDDFGVAVSLENLAIANLMLGDVEQALTQGVLCVSTASALGSKPGIVYGLLAVGAVHAHSSRPVEAARLLGAAEAIRESIQEPELEVLEARIQQAAVTAINEQLSPPAVAEEWSRGRSMTADEAAAYAVASGLRR